ncbi:hypothetical protein HKX48_002539, partial [Thoreauomyces humboldtii]
LTDRDAIAKLDVGFGSALEPPPRFGSFGMSSLFIDPFFGIPFNFCLPAGHRQNASKLIHQEQAQCLRRERAWLKEEDALLLALRRRNFNYETITEFFHEVFPTTARSRKSLESRFCSVRPRGDTPIAASFKKERRMRRGSREPSWGSVSLQQEEEEEEEEEQEYEYEYKEEEEEDVINIADDVKLEVIKVDVSEDEGDAEVNEADGEEQGVDVEGDEKGVEYEGEVGEASSVMERSVGTEGADMESVREVESAPPVWM